MHLRELFFHRVSSKNADGFEVTELSQLPDELQCLDGQLSSWGEDEGSDAAWGWAHSTLSSQLLQEGDDERSSLTRPSARHTNHISALDNKQVNFESII